MLRQYTPIPDLVAMKTHENTLDVEKRRWDIEFNDINKNFNSHTHRYMHSFKKSQKEIFI